MEVTDDGLAALLVQLVGKQEPRGPSLRTDVGGLAAGSGAHVEDPLVLLGCQGHDRQHGGCPLQH
ncbi:unnamed protein product, partial [Ixodes pacificus]